MWSCLREMLLRVVAGSQVPPPPYSKIYEAGMACKDAPVAQLNLGFLFLNRFLDICDTIEDPESTEIDNSDFLQTDPPSPYEVELPESWWVKPDVVEDIRDWVLQGAVDKSVENKLR